MIGKTVSHYRIIEKIGEGGMGVVYKAEDTKLKRYVALKFLPTSMTAIEEAKNRFIQEAQTASALDHPNICTIYEIDEIENEQMFIAMAYYEGETLKQKITAVQFSVDDMIDITSQIAEGLAKAHQHGILHLDIKPANIIITNEGVVKILDFGLARLTGQWGLAKTGMTAGTLAYMSPEQARGEELDQRTDIWSLGVTLYETITGQLPFKGDYEQAMMYSIMNESPESITTTCAGMKIEFEQIVNKALCKNLVDRYRSVEEMLTDLRKLNKENASDIKLRPEEKSKISQIKRTYQYGGIAVLLALLITVVLYLSSGQVKTIDSLALLPLVNESADPNVEYLSDGITESLINSLSKSPKLRVIARTTVFNYKGKQVDPRKIGKELNVSAVLTGKVVQRGDILIIQTELVDVANGAQLWGERYNQKIEDILAIQDDITKQILEKLRIKLTGVEQTPLIRNYTENTLAYQLYLKGRYYWNKRTPEQVTRAIDYFEQAIEEDQSYALAYAGLADSYSSLGTIETGVLPPREIILKAESASIKALEIDGTLAEAHTSLANVRFTYQWDWKNAEIEFKKAIELNPNYATAHHWYAHYLVAMGRLNEALIEENRALALDPLSLVINTQVGMVFYYMHHYDQAIEQYQKTLEIDPDFTQTHLAIGLAYERKSMFNEAIAEFNKASSDSSHNPITLALLAYAYAKSVNKSEALRILDELNELGKRQFISPFHIALIYLGLDKKNEMYEWLEKAYDERSNYLVYLKVEPLADNLRSDSRFIALLDKMGL